MRQGLANVAFQLRCGEVDRTVVYVPDEATKLVVERILREDFADLDETKVRVMVPGVQGMSGLGCRADD